MKTLITLFLTVLFTTLCVAQQGINYKALIKDDNGNVVASQNITVQFQILQGAGMTNVYQETHTPTTDANGLIILNIGEGTTSDVFEDINWASDTTFLNTKINTGTGLVDMGTTEFKTVPYALHANSVNGAVTKINDLLDGKSDANGSSLFIGQDAGASDDGTANQNVGIGYSSLALNTTGSFNTANGSYSLSSNTTGGWNTANGRGSLNSNTTGSENTANGFYALRYNTTGSFNTANGSFALYNNTTGNNNTANGTEALYSNTTGIYNTAIGSSSLPYNTIGNFNVALGYHAGINHTTGSDNIFIGKEAGRFNTIPEESNRLYIDNGYSFDPLIYGEFDTRLVRINGTLDVLEGITSVATGNANMIPIAYGTIDSAGNILSGTGNYTVNTANAPTFHINVTGSSLSHTNSSASVTPLSGAFRTSSITHSNGALRVYIFNSSGTQVANTFQFVIYEL